MWWNNICFINNDFIIKDKTIKQLNKFKNNQIFQIMFNRYYTMSKNRYKPINLPDTMSERVITDSLIWNGTVYPFQFMGAHLALPGSPGGKINIYGDISNAFVYGYNGFNQEIGVVLPGSEEAKVLKQTNFMVENPKDGKGVLVRENDQCFPFINVIIYYASQVADCIRTLDIQKGHLKNPYLVFCEESQEQNIKKFYNNLKNNEDFIVSTGIFPADKVHIENLTVSGENVNTVISTIEWLDNQFKALCGIENNSAVDKKGENLVNDEVHINNDYTMKNIQYVIDKINEGFELYNDVFGTNIKFVPIKTKEEKINDDILGLPNKEPKYLSKS